MTRRTPVALAAAFCAAGTLAVASCAGSGSSPSEPRMASATSRAPYDAPPVNPGPVTVTLNVRPARQILALLAKTQYDENEARAIELLPTVQAAIQESGRGADVFERDLAAAFDEQVRFTFYDFRRIRDDRSKWEDLLSLIASGEAELTKKISDRARALLPAQPAAAATLPVSLTFGLPGRTDQIVARSVEGGEPVQVIDLARALADLQASAPPEQIRHLTRLITTEAYARAWAQYRSNDPAWSRHDGALGQLEPLLRAVAERGPVAMYGIDENFFPLATWLKEPMRTSLDDMNRVADKLLSTEGDLDARVSLASEVRRPDFAARVAGPAGAFLSDGIISSFGIDAYRTALASGPTAFFQWYDKASRERGRELIPLSKAIKDRLAAAAGIGETVTPRPKP